MRRQLALIVLALASAAVVSGCVSEQIMLAHSVELKSATRTIPQNQLLDVGVVVFDPGVPKGKVDPEVKEDLADEGTYVQVRRAESMVMAVDLRDTLQDSGHWGSVWVTPKPTTTADLNVKATILESDGDMVELHVEARDATGKQWLDKDYEFETAASAYNRQRYPNADPYQDIFNEIANDLAAIATELPTTHITAIHRVAALRYAAELSPDAFSEYVDEDDGHYELVRLPAASDPIYVRTQQARQREDLFLDTLNLHYTAFANQAQDPYHGWRKASRQEAITIRQLKKSARWRTGLGIAAIVGSVLYGGSGNNQFSDRLVRNALVYVGAEVLRAASVRRQERRMHSQSLAELSSDFNADVRPLVVDIKGTQHRLTGTIEAQYQEWRNLLHRLFVTETGFGAADFRIYEGAMSGTGSASGSGTDASGRTATGSVAASIREPAGDRSQQTTDGASASGDAKP